MEEKSTLRVNMASKSEEDVLQGCLGAIDGWLVNIRKFNGRGTVNVISYLSGHYQTMGVSVQALLR
jgi:hypothetical protein